MARLLWIGLSVTAFVSILILTENENPPSASPAVSPELAQSIPEVSTRNLLFTEQWRFAKGDHAGARERSFDDSSWRVLDLPHDWSIEGPFDPKLASCTAFLPCGIAWYRKTFETPAEAAGKCINIRFDGVMNHSTVWCNGVQVGERPYGYSSFTCDLTPAIKFGGLNTLAVRVNHEQNADSRWYAGSGIYRNVFLNITNKVHVDPDGVFVTTPKVQAESAEVHVQTVVKNERAEVATVTVVTIIKDAQDVTVAATEQADSTPANGRKQFNVTIKIPRPALWSPEHPNTYRVQTLVKRGDAVIDEYNTRFGVRTFVFDPQKGFFLNGQSLKIKGVCLHHDAGALGAAVPIQVWRRRLKLLKDAGCNAIRCSHNPPDPAFLDLCDEMGFLVIDEAFDEWNGPKKKWILGRNVGEPGKDGYHSDFEKWADIDIRDMVLRDRNHPSIIMWSIGNEIDYTNDPFPPKSGALIPVAERLIKAVKSVDTTRPVTAACAFPATNLFKQLLDVEGYNYMERLYTGAHAAHPNRAIFGSENSHSLAAWQAVTSNDFISGQFLWTGIDFLGEAGVWPAHGSGAGLLDLAGFPKPRYYFRKSLWSDVPMVYLFAGGSGVPGIKGGADGKAINCVTNCESVELFHDGKSLGSKPHAFGEILTWPVSFTVGELKAVGKKGTATAAFEHRMPGSATKLVLVPDVTGLKGDGRDVVHFEVNAVDRDGTLVPKAANLVACKIDGPGRIIGIENGNLRSTEDYKAPTHSLYQGRMLIYVQSQKNSGQLVLTVSADKLQSASTTLQVR